MFCSHCYRNGKFILPDINAFQMQERVKRKLKEVGFPGFIAGWFARNIPKLERWTKASYRKDNLMADGRMAKDENMFKEDSL